MGRFETNIAASSGASRGSGRSWAKTAKRWLYWGHRWLGVITCVLCVMWFLSGLVMLYVPFPSWTDQERLTNLPVIDAGRVAVRPDDAMATAGVKTLPTIFRLEMLADEPVYRIVAAGGPATISAVTGLPVSQVDAEQARRHVSAVFPNAAPRLLETLDYDQWTVTRRFDPHRPLYKFVLDDGLGTTVYVSSKTGEIVQNATGNERFWNWLGAVPHWIYFSPIRKDQQLWRQSVMWLSGPLIIGAITGLWIGILRLRVRRPYKGGRGTPYRGWMKWHHVGGLIGGVFLTTWIASGWLSVNPFSLFARTQFSDVQRVAYAGWSEGHVYGVMPAAIAEAGRRVPTEVSFVWVGGQARMIVRNDASVLLADPKSGEPAPIADDMLVKAARQAFPSASVVAGERLTEEEIYWYSHHHKRPLPVVKVVFDDPDASWLFLDPATGAIAGLSDSDARTYRWLFNFLHDYDLPILLRNQPARDILVWLLSIAGLVVSVSGVVIGWRTLVRQCG
ncbi:PepSY domain-containing protein [Hyphomicrobium sp. LHD-15]|uniref:PepSY domain-containing protein n=1 Tax=Hyphomicrobium sp. LHD-15 TaxID=3072142 RepID=UPI00280FF538|nr:PepSY domain-containing protein [Hyphomicrobium sp. LHD-15]MDQ8699162.1 PepSY domain-containing protein [Hyphomicrobium sp. LHD-15]